MKTSKIALFIVSLSFVSGILWGNFSSYIKDQSEQSLAIENSTNGENILTMQTLENNITSLAQDISPSVVSIVIKKDLALFRENPFGFFRGNGQTIETEIGGWTWFFVDENGTIITNKHVVADPNASFSVILNNWEEFDALVLALDSVNDLAVIKIDYESVPIDVISKDDDVQIGQFVVAIWNALSEFQNSVSFGVVSGKDRIIQAGWSTLSSLIQTDTAINPGNSGGPLLNIQWEVIGINTAVASGQWLGFSIELTEEKIAYMLSSIEEYWEIKKPFIGIYYIPLNTNIASELWLDYSYWVYVPDEDRSIIEWSAASKAWVQRWDTVLSIDWEKITFENNLDIILQNKFPWEVLELEVLRDNGTISMLDLVLGKG